MRLIFFSSTKIGRLLLTPSPVRWDGHISKGSNDVKGACAKFTLLFLARCFILWWYAHTVTSHTWQYQTQNSTRRSSFSQVSQAPVRFVVHGTDRYRSRYDARLSDQILDVDKNAARFKIWSGNASIVLFKHSTISQGFQLCVLSTEFSAIRSLPRLDHSDAQGKESMQRWNGDDWVENKRAEEKATVCKENLNRFSNSRHSVSFQVYGPSCQSRTSLSIRPRIHSSWSPKVIQ